jgi:hypothetical protein
MFWTDVRMNEHDVNDVRQTERHTAEALVPEPSLVEVEIAIEWLKVYKSPAEMIEATSCSKIHKLINSI